MSTLTTKVFEALKQATDDQQRWEVLEKYSYDYILKTVLSYIYNPLIDFGLKDFTPQSMGKPHGMGLSKFLNIPQEILELKLSEEEAAYKCNLALQHINEDEAEIFISMMKKDDRYNLSLDLINEAWPNLVPEIIVSEPVEFTPIRQKSINFPCAIQNVSHGLRVYITVRANTVEFRTREGEIIKQFEPYSHQFSELAQNGNVVFHGHAVKVDDEMNKLNASDEEILNSEVDQIKFILWDVVKYEGFVKGIDNQLGYNWRFNGLEHMMYLAVEKNPTPCYAPIQQAVVGDLTQIQEFAEKMGGGIIKSFEGEWVAGPNPNELIILP